MSEALTTKNTNVILAIVEELSFRNGLDIALDNLTEKSVMELLGFIYKKCDSAEHQKLVFTLTDLVMNRLNKMAPVSRDLKVDNLLADIADKLTVEIDNAKETAELGGLIELIEAQY